MALRPQTPVPAITWLAGLFLVFVFLTGGGSRYDIASLILLRPVAAAAAVVFFCRLTAEDWRTLRVPLWLAAAAIATTLLHLLLLPPGAWQALPGRAPLIESARLVGLTDSWQAFSIVPWRTMNALLSWLVPLAALAAAAAGDTTHRARMLPVLLVMALASGFLSVLQVISPADSPLYLYRITNTGEAVGMFANRNHQALLLTAALPMLAAYACIGVQTVEQQRRRVWMSLAAGAPLLPLVLVVGSRAGLLLLGIALVSIPLIYRAPDIVQRAKRGVRIYNPVRIGLAAGAVALVAISFLLSRATAIERLGGTEVEGREEIWARSWGLVHQYFPWGSGFGTFVEAYQYDEPRALLTNTYANHAHNDWLEILATGGLPGALLLLAAVVAWVLGVRALWLDRANGARAAILGRTGACILFMIAVASVVDYPARTPSIAALGAVTTAWMAYAIVRKRPV